MSRVIESGINYYFYRPKAEKKNVRSFKDVQRFYLVMAPEDSPLYRLIIIGQKYLPSFNASKESRDWAIIDFVGNDPVMLRQDKLDKEKTVAGRPVEPARPVGIASYQIIWHEDHTEIAEVLVAPTKPGKAQAAFNLSGESSYILKVKNPAHTREGFPGAEQNPGYPADLAMLFDEDWINLKDRRLLNFYNTQLLLIGGVETNVEDHLNIKIDRQSQDQAINKLFETFDLDPKIPIKPLTSGEWPT